MSGYAIDSYAAPVYVTAEYGDPQLKRGENSWVAILGADGQPIMDTEVFGDDTGETNYYCDLPEGVTEHDLFELPERLEEIASVRRTMAEDELAAWAEWLSDQDIKPGRLYPRDFANEFDLLLPLPGESIPEGAEACTIERAAELLNGEKWHGEIYWPGQVSALSE